MKDWELNVLAGLIAFNLSLANIFRQELRLLNLSSTVRMLPSCNRVEFKSN